MLSDYRDIISRISEPPKWWDSNGVPRYDDFHPHDVPNIYAKEAVLYRIDCQACGEQFLVAQQWAATYGSLRPLSEWVAEGKLHYGDPPIHGGLCVGTTMNCEDRYTIQFWRQEDNKTDWGVHWIRVPELEGIKLDKDYAAEVLAEQVTRMQEANLTVKQKES